MIQRLSPLFPINMDNDNDFYMAFNSFHASDFDTDATGEVHPAISDLGANTNAPGFGEALSINSIFSIRDGNEARLAMEHVEADGVTMGC